MDTELLTERLHLLAEDAPLPGTAAAHDIARGRRRARRRRTAITTGVVAACAVAGVAWTAAGDGAGHAADPAPPVAGNGPAESAGDELADRVVVLGEQPGSPEWERLAIPEASVRATVAVLQQHADPSSYRILALGAGRAWADLVPGTCPAAWTCSPVAVDGAAQAMLAETDDVVQVAAEFPEGSIVVTIAADDVHDVDLAYGGDDADRIRFEGGRD
ncbi:MAG TPA: hypothetical protein VM575_11550 [Nocardioides sp.]|nr:hypothetical protein [Nocardioides sp.]